MKPHRTVNFLLTAFPAVIASLVAVNASYAAVVIYARPVEGDIVITGEGSLNLDALTFAGPNRAQNPRVNGSVPTVIVGPLDTPTDSYRVPENFVAPSVFGPRSSVLATSGSGDAFGLSGESHLYVPSSYVSEDPLSGTSIYSGKTIKSLLIDVGIYTWSWGEGETADSLTLNFMPEPGSFWLCGVMAVILGLAMRRSKAVARME